MRWLLVTLALVATGAALPAEHVVLVIPRPASVVHHDGIFILKSPVRIATIGARADLREIADDLQDYLKNKTGFAVDVTPGSGGAGIVLEVSATADAAAVSREAYELTVGPAGIRIRAGDPTGVFWGVQTLRQLLPPDVERGGRRQIVSVPSVTIRDTPRFAWRGSLLDVGRHFFPVSFVKRHIDLLALYKMNVLHWHLTEDQGWRLDIPKYPRLTSVGAWRTEPDGTRYGGFYSRQEVREIVEYARRRHVTVVPEIEMPGHASAALAAYPELSCTGAPTTVPTAWGVFEDVFCPGKEETFRFLQDVLDEVMALFPSKAIHVGGDEVPKDRWKACARCQQRMRDEGLRDERELQSYFIRRIDAYVRSKGREITGWDEILEGGLAPGATVQVWRDVEHAKTTVRLGNRVIQSPTGHAYLNRAPDELPLARVFAFEPVPDGLSAEEAGRIRGGEATFWSEQINEANFDQMAFPRLLAMAEVLWSDATRDFADFKRRLDAGHDPRLRALGVFPGPEDRPLARITPVFDPATSGVRLRIDGSAEGLDVRFTTDGTVPTPASAAVREATTFTAPGVVRVQPFLNGKPMVQSITFSIERHAAVGRPVRLVVPNSSKYIGTGPLTLTDGLHGTTDFRDGLWHGWEGDNLEAVIDLGRVAPIGEVELSTLQAMRSWILLPRLVMIWLSDDGTTWRQAASLSHEEPARRADPFLHRFRQAMPAGTVARFVKVLAENAGPLPDWHPGAGGRAWVFADEIAVRVP